MSENLINGIAHVALIVDDFDKALKFYTEGLGFKLFTKWGKPESPIALIDTGNNNYIELFGNGDAVSDSINGYAHLAFACEDVEKMYNRAILYGAKPYSEPRVVTPDAKPQSVKINYAFVISPTGEQVEFFRFL